MGGNGHVFTRKANTNSVGSINDFMNRQNPAMSPRINTFSQLNFTSIPPSPLPSASQMHELFMEAGRSPNSPGHDDLGSYHDLSPARPHSSSFGSGKNETGSPQLQPISRGSMVSN